MNISFIVSRCSIERTKFAANPTDIRVIENSSNDVGDIVAGNHPLSLEIGECCQIKRVGMLE